MFLIFGAAFEGNMGKDTKKKIANNPTTQKIKNILPIIKLLRNASWIAGKIGIKKDSMDKFRKMADELIVASDILELPNRFNTAFGAKGWISTGSFSLDVMRAAVKLHDNGKFEEAEAAIAEWYTEDNIRLFAITRSRRFHAAHLRNEQLEEALRLYLEERYMAAIPLILIACDGFASDVSGGSPFEKNADLSCFDSIPGHQTSLPALMKLFTLGVRKSTDEDLIFPKRHGILHGRSLGYANKIVCMKAWLLMIALVDWAIDKSSEETRIEEHLRIKNTSLRDILEKSQRIQNDKKIIETFQISEKAGPLTGSYDPHTPEFSLLEFMEGWKNKNFGRMSKYVVNFTNKSVNKMAGEVREMVKFVTLNEYEIIRIRYSTVARCDARIRILAKTLTKEVSGEFNVILFRYNADGDIAMPSNQDCIWAVQQNCIYNVMNEKFADPE